MPSPGPEPRALLTMTRPPPFAVRFGHWVGDLAGLTRTEHHLALSIAVYSNAVGVAWPGRERLAHDTRCTRRTVERTLKQLVAKGVLEVVTPGGGRGRATVYRLHDPSMGDTTVAVSLTRRATEPARKGVMASPKGVAGTPQEVERGMEEGDEQSCVECNGDRWVFVAGSNTVSPCSCR